MGAEALERVRFGMALRGYRMAEVDDLLDRLAAELRERDARLAALEGHCRGREPLLPARPGRGPARRRRTRCPSPTRCSVDEPQQPPGRPEGAPGVAAGRPGAP